MKKLLILFLLFSGLMVQAQKTIIKRVEPLNWWIGMKNPNLQLLVYGQDLSLYTPELNYPGVTIIGIERTNNKNYLFINLTIAPEAKAGTLAINMKTKDKIKETIRYELKDREKGSVERKGFNSGDLIYQIFPDRFVNGDTKNDVATGYPDITSRKEPFGRHGGDIQGILNNLDYISSMGYTAIWVTPVTENNMKEASYHGYAITDFYHVDPRHGTNELYKKLSDECKSRGIKLIMDIVINHCGTEWWIYKDLPSNDWLNNYPDIKLCNFRGTTIFDPHHSEIDIKTMTDGWFTKSMPDINQRNPLVANYLIQNNIWWIEFGGLSGIRSDTHQYPDKEFVSVWAKKIMDEYPEFNIVGEVWLNQPAMISYWQKDAPNLDGFNSNLPTIMDFPLHFALRSAFSEGEGWDTGMTRFYELFSHDFLMANPMNIMTFADNHDVSRFYTLLGENLPNYKLAMALLLTTRGIPKIYSGTELLMTGDEGQGHGLMRKDFPGGWAEDKTNAFTQVGLTADQIDAQNYMKIIQNWRKTNDAVKFGKMIQFIPQNGFYVYFRIKDKKSVMIILNNNKETKSIETARFTECLNGHSTGKEVISNTLINLTDKIEVPSKTALIIELD